MKAEFLTVDDPRWAAFLRRVPHDVYHLPGYVAASAGPDGGTATAFYAEDDAEDDAEDAADAGRGAACLIPLIIRPLPDALGAPDLRDAVSPYGYPAPLLAPADAPPTLLGRFLDAFAEAGRAHGLVSAFLRLHPLGPLGPLSAEVLRAHGTLVPHGATVYLDLTRPPDVLDAAIRTNHRRDLRRLHRLGFTARMDDWACFADFRRLYADTMRRVGADAYYFFEDDYFTALRQGLGEGRGGALHLCTVHAPGGTVASAGLFTAVGEIAQYHLSGTDAAFLSFAPLKLVIDHARRWAADAGYHALHLGGGLGAREDALFHFKSGFTDTRAAFHSLRLIFDPPMYATLARRAHATDLAPDAFFPAYRLRRDDEPTT